MRLATVLGAALLATALATPAVAAPCKTPRQLKLQWQASSGKGQIHFIAHGCSQPASCPVAAGTLAAKLPIEASLKAGDVTVFVTEIKACDDPKACVSINSGGCQGGDAIKDSGGLVKLAYQRKGTTSVTARLRGKMSRPPAITGPATITFTDAAGYTVQATFEKCRTADRTAGVTVICR